MNASTPSKPTKNGSRTSARRPERAGRTTGSSPPPERQAARPTNLTRRFRRLLHGAELRTIRFHDLRHSTATLLLEQGVDLVVIKKLLGHAHIGVTAGVYAHVRLRLQRQAIDTLGSILGTTDDPPSAAVVR
ncbi:tyrosine-type recombinase/integrase [Streptomyces sp. NPDC090052]|uniref:tyrosine-type recombinase/integrase n=1 Tax=Streptomyces sp. NPDC090052 TaxID=3365931 RepID=UPI00382C8500